MDVHPHTPSDGGMSRLSKSLGDRPSPDTLVSGHGFNLPYLAVDGEFRSTLPGQAESFLSTTSNCPQFRPSRFFDAVAHTRTRILGTLRTSSESLATQKGETRPPRDTQDNLMSGRIGSFRK